MASTRVALILGAGPRIGTSVAEKFASNGYKVAVVSRSSKPSSEEFLSLSADFSKPDSIVDIFSSVKSHFNAAPSVVVYNAAAVTPPPDKSSLLSVPKEDFVSDLNVNTVSPYVAAQQAVLGWESLPKEVKKTFIYTGNILNTLVRPVPFVLDLGVGKSASAYWVGAADSLYAEKGFRFFYADERLPDGQSKGMNIDGPAHANFYSQLAEHEGDVPWHATFVAGKGYAKL